MQAPAGAHYDPHFPLAPDEQERAICHTLDLITRETNHRFVASALRTKEVKLPSARGQLAHESTVLATRLEGHMGDHTPRKLREKLASFRAEYSIQNIFEIILQRFWNVSFCSEYVPSQGVRKQARSESKFLGVYRGSTNCLIG